MAEADTDIVAALLRGSFDPAVQPYLAYCQPGISRYLRVLLNNPASYPTHHFYVSEDAGVDGFAEWREVDGACLLTYVCVAASARGAGVASRLIDEHLRRSEAIMAELDVFADNSGALALYERLGFRETTRTGWWTRPVPTPSTAQPEGALVDWHVSAASMDSYGFCRASLQTALGAVSFGLTSPSVARLESVAQLQDDILLEEIACHLPAVGSAFVLTAAGDRPEGAERVVESVRLRAQTADVRAALQ